MTDTTSADACRAEFEAWIDEDAGQIGYTLKKHDGSYAFPSVAVAWHVWQNAWNTRPAPKAPEGFDRIIVDRPYAWQMPKYKCNVCGRDDFRSAHYAKVHVCDSPSPQAQQSSDESRRAEFEALLSSARYGRGELLDRDGPEYGEPRGYKDFQIDLAWNVYNDALNSVQQAQQADSVPMPQNEDQAFAMQAIGYAWLRDNAPHRLKQPNHIAAARAEGRREAFSECINLISNQPCFSPIGDILRDLICKIKAKAEELKP